MHSIDPEKALAELKWLGLAVSTDATRFNIGRLHVDGQRAVTTDGHRLHYIQGTCLPLGFSIRGGEIAHVLDLSKSYSLQAVEFHAGHTYWRFESADGSCELKFRISNTDGYPQYEHVLPKATDATELQAKELRKVYIQPNDLQRCVIGKGHFDTRYIADALRGAPKTVSVQLPEDAFSGVLIRYENRTAVVMPTRQ